MSLFSNRWRSQNFSLKRSPEEISAFLEQKEKDKQDRILRIQMLALLVFFCNFIFWFDDPQLSSGQSILLGVVFVLYLIYMVNHNILHVLYVFTVYISFQKVLAGDFGGNIPVLNMTNILLIIIIGAWWSRSFLRGEKVFQFHAIDFFVIIYTLLLTIALLRGEYIRKDVGVADIIIHFKRVTESFFVYFLFVNNVKNRDQIKHILFCVCCVLAAVGVMGVKQYYMDIGGGSWSDMDKNKITILTKQPNQLASYFCNYSFYLLAAGVIYWKKWWGVLIGLLFFFCYQSVRVTFSRGGIMSFYIAAIIVLILLYRMKFILVAIPIFAIVMAFPEKVLGPRLYKTYVNLTASKIYIDKTHMPDQSGEINLDESAMSRWWIIQAGLTRVQEDVISSFFGVGLGLFPFEIVGRHPNVYFIDAHNQWLLILVECGTIALVSFWSIFGVCTWKAFYIYLMSRDRMYRVVAIGYLGGLTGLFIANFFGSRMNSNEITHFHWIMTAVLIRVDRLVKAEVAQRAAQWKQRRWRTFG